jgi:hypothetical protein
MAGRGMISGVIMESMHAQKPLMLAVSRPWHLSEEGFTNKPLTTSAQGRHERLGARNIISKGLLVGRWGRNTKSAKRQNQASELSIGGNKTPRLGKKPKPTVCTSLGQRCVRVSQS